MIKNAGDQVNVYNLGTDEYCEVNDSVGWICRHLGLNPRLTYSGGERGWGDQRRSRIGDVSFDRANSLLLYWNSMRMEPNL
ncbi:MAG: hypothetical protein MUO77_18905 [Anaerolineales bacterium]|nr:hypothetical protein [Anaerolineales bacterium]